MAKILLTGASGMVGRNILEHEYAKEHRWLTPTRDQCNYLNYDSTYKYIASNMPDIIIHAAGRVGGIQANIQNPVEFLVENTDIGRNLIMAAFAHGVPRLINLGSSCMYPKDRDKPLLETEILTGMLEPTNEGYALAKIFALRLCQYITNSNANLSYKTLIPCNLYGRWDHFDPELSHMIAATIRKIDEAKRTNCQIVPIWGNGLARREFMFAADFADFIFLTIDQYEKVPSILNVGYGIDFTINQYYETVGHIIGYSGNFFHDLNKPVGINRKLMDNTKISALGWKAHTSLGDGIEKTYKFYMDNYL